MPCKQSVGCFIWHSASCPRSRGLSQWDRDIDNELKMPLDFKLEELTQFVEQNQSQKKYEQSHFSKQFLSVMLTPGMAVATTGVILEECSR